MRVGVWMEVWILYCYLLCFLVLTEEKEEVSGIHRYRAIVVCIYIAVETVGGIKKILPFFFSL